MKRDYNRCLKEVGLDSSVDTYRTWLVGGFFAIEYLSNNTTEIKAKGLYNYDYAKDLFSEENFIDNANKILLQCIN